jgi:hypothetical protein
MSFLRGCLFTISVLLGTLLGTLICLFGAFLLVIYLLALFDIDNFKIDSLYIALLILFIGFLILFITYKSLSLKKESRGCSMMGKRGKEGTNIKVMNDGNNERNSFFPCLHYNCVFPTDNTTNVFNDCYHSHNHSKISTPIFPHLNYTQPKMKKII